MDLGSELELSPLSGFLPRPESEVHGLKGAEKMISEKCEWVIQLPNWAAHFYAGGVILLMFALAALVFAMAWAILKNKI